MKMIKYLLLTLLLLPVTVLAASTPRVLTLEATENNKVINYNGTIEPGSTAVMCKLYDSSDVELDLLSSPVDNNEFEGSFAVSKKGTYKIRCANYEGGETKEVTVGAESISESSKSSALTTKKATNPKTYDKGIKSSVILFTVSSISMLISSIYLKKKKNKRLA